MNWVWCGIMLLIAMFCKVEGGFAHDEGKSKRGREDSLPSWNYL